MKRLLAGILVFLSLCWTADARFPRGTPASSNPNLRQQNFFGLTGSAWTSFTGNYTPGLGNPAVSTADYYHSDGVYWLKPFDLTATDCGATGASIAASRGRYVWFMSPDHSAGYPWADAQGIKIGFSSDPGVPPSTMTMVSAATSYTTNPLAKIADVTASIAGTTFTVTAVTGVISFDNNSIVAGTGVTLNTKILSQTTNTDVRPGGTGTYLLDTSQTVGSRAMTVSWENFSMGATPFPVCNPDDASFPFYLYAEGNAVRVGNATGYIKSADLVTWTLPIPTHIPYTFGPYTSYMRPVRTGVNTWYSTGFQANFPQTAGANGYAKWTSTDGVIWIPGSSLFSACLPVNASGTPGAQPCTAATATFSQPSGAPPRLTVGAQDYSISNTDTYLSGVRTGNQWVTRAPIDANFNVISSPAIVNISSAYAGLYPGPTYMNEVSAYVEDGVAHYYAAVGFPPSSSLYGLVDAAPYLNGGACTPGTGTTNCGGLWQEATDYFTEIVDATAAAGAAPVGVKASCASSVASLTWAAALPQQTYRLYRGTTAGTQATLVGDFTGTSATDSGMTLNAVTYYKLVYLNGGTEQKNRVVSTYCSSSIYPEVNAHLTRASVGGADMTTCNRTFMDTFYAWLTSNGMTNNLLFASMPEFCVAKSGSNISKVFDMGTTRLPRGGDYTPVSPANTTYNATGINSKPAWVNSANTAYGYYGGGRFNNIRRKTQITLFAAYQKPGAAVLNPFVSGQFSNRMMLSHTSGTPGAINCLLADATQQKTATATVSGLATDVHTASCTFDGTNWLAYSDAVAGSLCSGCNSLVIPSPNLNPPDNLTGQIDNNPNVNSNWNTIMSGTDAGLYNNTTGYYSAGNAALASFRGLFIFDKAFSGAQETSFDALVR